MSSLALSEKEIDRDTITRDVEFVQMLANPAYLSFLAQNGYLDNEEFIKYLFRLRYLKKPPFVFMINFPNSLVFLDLLLSGKDEKGNIKMEREFKMELKRGEFIDYIHKQQYYQWLNNK